MRFRSFQSLHPNCTPFGRATSHIGRTLGETAANEKGGNKLWKS